MRKLGDEWIIDALDAAPIATLSEASNARRQ
jgi:hypothetical protein